MRIGQVFELGPLQLQAVRVYFLTAGDETPARHDLPNAPIGYIAIRTSRGCNISDGVSGPALGVVPLKCDTADVEATILVISQNLTDR